MVYVHDAPSLLQATEKVVVPSPLPGLMFTLQVGGATTVKVAAGDTLVPPGPTQVSCTLWEPIPTFVAVWVPLQGTAPWGTPSMVYEQVVPLLAQVKAKVVPVPPVEGETETPHVGGDTWGETLNEMLGALTVPPTPVQVMPTVCVPAVKDDAFCVPLQATAPWGTPSSDQVQLVPSLAQPKAKLVAVVPLEGETCTLQVGAGITEVTLNETTQVEFPAGPTAVPVHEWTPTPPRLAPVDPELPEQGKLIEAPES